MEVLYSIARCSIYFVMAIAVIAAFCVVTLGNLFYAAIGLVVVLAGTAIVFLALHAEFLAVIQILLYVGAIMTLVIFAIMMTSDFGDKNRINKNNLVLPGFLLSVGIFAALAKLLLNAPWKINQAAIATRLSTADLGAELMTKYVFPFEVISVVLVAALVGAIVIARKDKAK